MMLRTLPVVNKIGEVLPIECWHDAVINFLAAFTSVKTSQAHLQAGALTSLAAVAAFHIVFLIVS